MSEIPPARDAELADLMLAWLQPEMLRATRPGGQLYPYELLIEEAAFRLARRDGRTTDGKP